MPVLAGLVFKVKYTLSPECVATPVARTEFFNVLLSNHAYSLS